MKKYWQQFWFSPEEALDLSIHRFVFFAFLLFIGQSKFDPGWVDIPIEFFHPISFYKLLGLSRPSRLAYENLVILWRCLVAFSCIGFLTPFSVLFSSFLSLYLFGLRYCYSYYHPEDNLLIIVSFIFALSPCFRVFSIDALLLRFFKPTLKTQTEIPSWPVRLIWLNWSLMFLSAAIFKLKTSGLSWIFSDNLRNRIIFNQYWFHFRKSTWQFGSNIAQFSVLCQIAAATVILFELIIPLIIFSKRFRSAGVISCFIFQILNWIVLLVYFDASFIFYIFFIPWSRWLQALATLWRNKMSRNGSM